MPDSNCFENAGSNAGKFDGAGFQEKRLKILIRNRTVNRHR